MSKTLARKRASTAVAACPLYGISPLALSTLFRVDLRTATQWKARLRKAPADAEAVARIAVHDLGAFDVAWSGFVVQQGKLWTPDNMAVEPGEVSALPHLYAQLNEYHRGQRWQLADLYEQQSAARRDDEVRRLLAMLTEAMRQR